LAEEGEFTYKIKWLLVSGSGIVQNTIKECSCLNRLGDTCLSTFFL